MRKLIAFFILMACPAVSSAIDFSVVRDESVLVKYQMDNVAISTSIILIDKSDTTNFPHKSSGTINISDIRVVIDKVAASSGSVHIGVLTELDGTDGSVTYFFDRRFDRDTTGFFLLDDVRPPTALYRTNVDSSGNTSYILSNSKVTANTAYQTDVALLTSFGTHNFPTVGDIILRLDMNGTTALDVDVEAFYHVKR